MLVKKFEDHQNLIELVLKLSNYNLQELADYLEIHVEDLEKLLNGQDELTKAIKLKLTKFYKYCLIHSSVPIQ